MMKIDKKKLLIWLGLIAALLAAIVLTGPPAGHHESIQQAMRDAVLHDTNRVSFFGLAVDPALISAMTLAP